MPSRLLLAVAVCIFLGSSQAIAQAAPALGDQIRSYRAAHEKEILGEFLQLLSLPNRASDTADIERNAQAIQRMLESRGVTVRLLRAEGAPPLILGELRSPGASRTVGIYAHYDGQPVDPKEWRSPPFNPVIRGAGGQEVDWKSQSRLDPEWRIYARSSSDDKAPVEATMAALDALRAGRVQPSVNLKFLFEGEEEAGSPHLPALLNKNPDVLDADIWLLCDGPVHQSRRMQVFFGARGTTDLELTVYGPSRPLHSGHYGNWAPNPIMLLVELLESMRDDNGSILIPAFYNDVRPLTPSEQQTLAKNPAPDDQLKEELAVPEPEGRGARLAAQILKPALNVRGIQGGHVGSQATNVISTEAKASIDFRLVPNQTPEHVRELVEEHIAKEGFFIVHQDPDLQVRRAHPRVVKLEWGPGYPAYRAPMENPLAQAVIRAIEEGRDSPIIQVVTLGGSVPMYLFEGKRHTPVIGVPIANHDSNQHGANENLRLRNLWDGIDVFAAIFARLGRNPETP
jgi:acetylornithine deacetylase/succinyl-diaminopimelate desuccinylase-like protein